MTRYIVKAPNKTFGGEIVLPASKSISNRALVINALAARNGGERCAQHNDEAPAGERCVTSVRECDDISAQKHYCALENVSDCDDTVVMVRALHGAPVPHERVVDIMAAGTAMRFLTAYFSVTEGTYLITGTKRMRHRPIGVLVDALRALGADIEYAGEEGFPPLRIRGRELSGGELLLPGNVSSQYISALLMIGPVLCHGLRLKLRGGIVSRPYIDLTLGVMRAYGAVAYWESDNVIRTLAGGYVTTQRYCIENDWSAASYWYEMVALWSGERMKNIDAESPEVVDDNLSESASVAMQNSAGAKPMEDICVVLPGLFENSEQGDRAVMDMFAPLGVKTEFSEDDGGRKVVRLTKCRARKMDVFEWDFVCQPDLAQTLVVTCCMLGQPFRFTGLGSLRIKETDRIAALETELRKFGYVLHDKDDSVLWWDGERCMLENETHSLDGGHYALNDAKPRISGTNALRFGKEMPVIDKCLCINTYDDHRMALSFAPICLKFGRVVINNPQVVSKSYPMFWENLREMGFEICEG